MPQSGSRDHAELCKKTFAVDAAVRFAGVIDRMGKLVEGGMREGLNPLESIKDIDKLYVEFALRNAMRHEFDGDFGRTIWAFSERERIKFATFPLPEDMLLLVSIEKNHTHDKIISRILELIS